ncbi:MAG TPA: OsmC family protein [Fimbriimonadaceae bacterium]|nr:OsmC family protein [Fimbriimonadaceae bacterium]
MCIVVAVVVTVDWLAGMSFQAKPEGGPGFTLDAHADFGGSGLGPTPIEAFLASVATCAAMDVLSILRKKRQDVIAYRIEIDGARPPEGLHPRPFTSLVLRHIVTGNDIDPAAVARAIELSEEKYCSVLATLRETPAVSSEFRIEEAEPAGTSG